MNGVEVLVWAIFAAVVAFVLAWAQDDEGGPRP
jgi:hypothetical protein